jgi:hypothetical protein
LSAHENVTKAHEMEYVYQNNNWENNGNLTESISKTESKYHEVENGLENAGNTNNIDNANASGMSSGSVFVTSSNLISGTCKIE